MGLTDDDKKLVTIIYRSLTSKNWAECDISRKDVGSLCRIIRELEKPDSQWQREAVELAKQNTSRRAEIENAPIVVGNGPTCHSWTLESWGGREGYVTHRARLVRIEEIE